MRACRVWPERDTQDLQKKAGDDMYLKGQMNLRSSEQNERTGEGTVGKREGERERRRKEGGQETREDEEAGWHLSGH